MTSTIWISKPHKNSTKIQKTLGQYPSCAEVRKKLSKIITNNIQQYIGRKIQYNKSGVYCGTERLTQFNNQY